MNNKKTFEALFIRTKIDYECFDCSFKYFILVFIIIIIVSIF